MRFIIDFVILASLRQGYTTWNVKNTTKPVPNTATAFAACSRRCSGQLASPGRPHIVVAAAAAAVVVAVADPKGPAAGILADLDRRSLAEDSPVADSLAAGKRHTADTHCIDLVAAAVVAAVEAQLELVD